MQKINFQNLPSTTTPINATNLNAIQTNAETAINGVAGNLSDYVDGTTAMGSIKTTGVKINNVDVIPNDTYTTTEQVVGKWTDGNTLYRKVIEGTTPSQSGQFQSLGFTMATIVREYLEFLSAAGFWVGRGYIEDNVVRFSYAISNGGSIYFSQLSNDALSRPYRLIIEYTKSTD